MGKDCLVNILQDLICHIYTNILGFLCSDTHSQYLLPRHDASFCTPSSQRHNSAVSEKSPKFGSYSPHWSATDSSIQDSLADTPVMHIPRQTIDAAGVDNFLDWGWGWGTN